MKTSGHSHDDINRDLGLGSRIAGDTHRILNRDGSFNVSRSGLPFYRSQNFYHTVLTMSWTKFFTLIFLGYVVANLIFAAGYTICGRDALSGSVGTTSGEHFLEAFFFSVQTLSTVGYGKMSPNGLAANMIVTIEAITGLLGFALATGILFARFARPSAKIMYSRNAVIAPYQNGTAFMFRIANERSNQLVEVKATVTFSRYENGADGKAVRSFYPLPLERDQVIFFPLHWVVVHPIDESSPLFGMTREEMVRSKSEFLILLTGFDETFSQNVHSRSSYGFDEVLIGEKFLDIFTTSENGKLGIDLRKIHDTQKV